nr:staphylococcus nuclease (SNase) domain protein [uncultured bacterium]
MTAIAVGLAALLLLLAGYLHGQESGPVVSVADGDTITVEINGKKERVRLIGVDAPEMDDSSPRVRCFAKAARLFAIDSLAGLTVKLEADPTQANRDRYGRLLRYVYWHNDLFNRFLIKKGFAREYTYDKPYRFQDDFKKAQKYAEESKWGLWDAHECR